MLERDADADVALGDRVPYPFSQDSGGMLQQWLAELQVEADDIDVAIDAVLESVQPQAASGKALDELGRDFGALGRRRGRDDEQYRSFLLGLVAAFDGRGTVPGVETAIAAGVLATADDVSLTEDFDTHQYEVILKNEAWSAHQSGTVRDLADLADPSVVELREPVHNRLRPAVVQLATGTTIRSEMLVSEAATPTITVGDTDIPAMFVAGAATPRISVDDTVAETTNSEDTFGTGAFDGEDTFS